jgi:hypothetical protein
LKGFVCSCRVVLSCLDSITVYHLDAGDLMPEIRASVAKAAETVSHYVRIETNAPASIEAKAKLSDVVPFNRAPARGALPWRSNAAPATAGRRRENASRRTASPGKFTATEMATGRRRNSLAPARRCTLASRNGVPSADGPMTMFSLI